MPKQPNHKRSKLRVPATIFYGIFAGIVVSVGFILITLFQLDREEGTMISDLVIAGVAVSLPVGIIAGGLGGWIFGRLFGK